MDIKEIISSARSGQVYNFDPQTEVGYMLTHKGRILIKSKFYIGDEIVATCDTTVGDFSHTSHIRKGRKLVVTSIIKASDYHETTFRINEDEGFAYVGDNNAFERCGFKPEEAAEFLMSYHHEITMRKSDESDVYLYIEKGIVKINTRSGMYEYDLKDLKNLIHAFYNAGFKICC